MSGGPVLVSGLAGAGKTLFGRSLEDLGYVAIDNVPLSLLPKLFETVETDRDRLVVTVDSRTRGFESFAEVVESLRALCPTLRVVFLEAELAVLQRRFSVSRRPHPIKSGSLSAAIVEEVSRMAPVRAMANDVIDTSALTSHDLRRLAGTLFGSEREPRMKVVVESFSYQVGVPQVASLVFDVRFLPNPYFVEALRPLPGDHPQVSAWLAGQSEVSRIVDLLSALVMEMLPSYATEMKSNVEIAVGCTGGRHRSVFVAARLAERIGAAGFPTSLHHRDRDRWKTDE